MASIPLVALTTLQYGGRTVRAGQPFVASSEQDARVLTKIGRAKRADSLTYQTAAVQSESESYTEPVMMHGSGSPPFIEPGDFDPEPKPKKRTYKRRDLTAESSE